jgi:hypothetical protein
MPWFLPPIVLSSWRSLLVNLVDPLAGQIGDRGKVRIKAHYHEKSNLVEVVN